MLATPTAGLLPSARLLLPRAIREIGAEAWNAALRRHRSKVPHRGVPRTPVVSPKSILSYAVDSLAVFVPSGYPTTLQRPSTVTCESWGGIPERACREHLAPRNVREPPCRPP